MKRNIIFLMICLLGLATQTRADSLHVDDISIQAGDTVSVSVSLSNTESNLVGFQLDVNLPQGVRIDRSKTKLSGRLSSDATLTIGKQRDGLYRLVCASLNLTPIASNAGELFTLSLVADANVESGKVDLLNAIFSTANGEAVNVANTSFNITRTNYTKSESLLVSDMNVHKGDTLYMPVNLTNTTTNLTAYQFDIYLPDGFEVAQNDDGYIALLNMDRHAKTHSAVINKMNGGFYRIVVTSSRNALISGTSGTIVTIPLAMAGNVALGHYNGSIRNIVMATNDDNDVPLYLKDITFKLKVEQRYSDTEKLSVAALSIHKGDTFSIPINLTNATTNLTAYQFDVNLPSGIELVPDEDGYYTAELNMARHTKSHTVTVSKIGDSAYRIVVTSSRNALITGTSGTLLTLSAKADDDIAADDYAGDIKNIIFSTNNEESVYIKTTPFVIQISAYALGDVNCDGVINSTDYVSAANYILGKPSASFNFNNADVYKDGVINVRDLTKIINLIIKQKQL